METLDQQLASILKEYTCFPDSIIKTQAKRLEKKPEELSRMDLKQLAPAIGKAIAIFSNPAKGEEVKNKILTLL